MWRKGNPCALLGGRQIGVAIIENSMEFPQKIKNSTIIWTRKGKKCLQIWMEEIKLSFFIDYMIIYVENVKELTTKFLELVSSYNKVVG